MSEDARSLFDAAALALCSLKRRGELELSLLRPGRPRLSNKISLVVEQEG